MCEKTGIDSWRRQIWRHVDHYALKLSVSFALSLDFEQASYSGHGCLGQDRLQFFLFALLLNEINEENWQKIPDIVMK